MNTKVHDLMIEKVLTVTPHQTAEHVRDLMSTHSVHCLPVVNPEGEPIGIVSTSDLLQDHKNGTPVSQFMTKEVLTVPQYSDVSVAARIMRNHHVHHVVVTHEKSVVGMISSFDLLRLVEDHRFVMKNAPTTSKKHGGKRQKSEQQLSAGE